MDIVPLTKELYKPDYDADRGTYYDRSPFAKRSRNNPVIECRCRVGTFLRTHSQFQTHIKTKTHQLFLDSYDSYYRDQDALQEEIKNLKIDNERLKRKLMKRDNIIKLRDQEIAYLSEKDNEDSKRESDESESDESEAEDDFKSPKADL